MTEAQYGIGVRIRMSYDQAIPLVRELLQREGFGVLTEIDVQKTLKQKLGVEFRRYVILGACNPQLAHRAFGEELEIGLLLPCNVIVYEEGPDTVVPVLDPIAALAVVGNPRLTPIAEEARARLERVIRQLQE